MASPDNDHSPTWPIVLTDAVWKANTLRDMGIYPVRQVRLIARCSWHGRMTIDVTTTELLDSDVLSGYIQCQGMHDGIRWLPIEETQLLPEKKL